MAIKEISFDTETKLIGKRPRDNAKTGVNPCPELVSAAFYDPDIDESVLYRGRRAVKEWIDRVDDPRTRLIGHNLAFDHTIMLRAAWDILEEDLMGRVVRSYENREDIPGGENRDTRIRQILIDIATVGMYRRTGGYALDNLVSYHLDADISDLKDGGWRLRYAELKPHPTPDWPDEAVVYAKADPEWTYRVYDAQKDAKRSALGPPVCYGRENDGVVVNEQFQAASDFALQVMGCWGLAVDGEKVQSLKSRYVERRDELEKRLQSWGMVDSDGKSNMDVQRQFFARCFRDAGVDPVTTPSGDKISTSKDARAKLRKAGYSSERMDALEEYNRICDYLTKYIEPMELSHPHGVFPNWNVLVESGRTSSSQPNMQNFPKRNHPNETIPAKEVRRCFRPRPGNVFVNADWSSAELRTLAQINENWNHTPVHMAESLREGRDLHLDFAAQLEGMDYDEAKQAYEADEKAISDARKVAKVANFGFPGGLQSNGFVMYAYDFGVEIEPHFARELQNAWMDRWSEMGQFFDRVRSFENNGGSVPIKQHSPLGNESPWRIRRCDSWTSAANSLFQGSAGDGAKFAMWELLKACYVDESSPLYGYRMNAFVHDEFLVEGPPDGAIEAALELRRIMVDGMEMMTPDVPIEADVEVGLKWGEGTELNPDELEAA